MLKTKSRAELNRHDHHIGNKRRKHEQTFLYRADRPCPCRLLTQVRNLRNLQRTVAGRRRPGNRHDPAVNANNTFVNKLVYVGQKDGTFYEKGTYDINGSIIKLETGSEISYYKKEKGQLRLLDYEKKEITGALADNYILKKIKDCAGKAENGK